MAKLTGIGDSIEGGSIAGQSRDPLIPRGLVPGRVYEFTADFNVRAHVTSPPPVDRARLSPTASTSPDDEVICKKAVIRSVKKHYSQTVATGSASHKASIWTFGSQTSVTVMMEHQSIADARHNREQAQLESEQD